MDRNKWNPEAIEISLNKRDRQEGYSEENKWDTWLKFMCNFLINFIGFDMYQCVEFHNCANHRLVTTRVCPHTSQRKFPKWTKIIGILCYWTNFRILMSLGLQYMYDFHKLNCVRTLNQLSQLTRNNGTPTSGDDTSIRYQARLLNLESTLGALNESLVQDRYWLKLWGTPYLEFKFVTECGYIIILLLGWALYWQLTLYHHHFRPPNFSLFRLFLDRGNERKNLNKMTIEEADKFIASSQNFASIQARAVMGRVKKKFVASTCREAAFRLPAMISKKDKLTVADIFSQHERIIKLIKQSFVNGKLEPINKNASYLRSMSVYYCISVVYFTSAFIIFTTFNTQVMPSMFPDILDFAGFMDYIHCADVSILSYFTCFWAVAGVTLMVMYSVDSITSIAELNRQIKRLLDDSGKKYAAIRVDQPHSEARILINDQLESGLTLIYLHYKFIIRQMNVVRPILSFYLTSTVSLIMVMVPALLFIHYPYIETGRKGLLFIGCFYVVFGDLCTLPTCYQHGRCVDLSKLFSSTFAHIIRLNEMACPGDQDGGLYPDTEIIQPDLFSYGHTMWLLHRELKSQNRLADQFQLKRFGIPNTYAYNLKFHFYLGLLLLFSLLLGSKIDVTTNEASFLSSSFRII